jgi:hypothetical protein
MKRGKVMNSKFLIRVLMFVMALVTVFSLAACNKPSGNENPTDVPTDSGEQPTTPPETPTTPPNVDVNAPDLPTDTYGGTEFKVYIRGLASDGADYSAELYVGQALGAAPTAVERAVYERMTAVADTYQVIFDVNVRAGGLDSNVVDSSAKTGVDVYDLIVDHGRFMFRNAAKNLLLDFADLPYVDTNQPWWNQEANETFRTAGGKLFTMTGDISYYSVGSAFAMFFNKDIIADIPELESPYEKVYNDEWTFAVFEEYVTTADSNLNGDNTGDIATDAFGYGTSWWRGPVQALYSTGERVLIRKNNEWRFTINKDICNRMFFDIRELLFDSGVAYLHRADDYSKLRNAFMGDKVAFFDDNIHAASVFKGSDLNFGLLPWPKYNDEVEEYYSAVDAGTNLYGVLRNTSEANAKRVSVILEALAYYGSRDVMPFYYDTILSYQYLKDDDSIEMLHIIHDHLVMDIGYFYSSLESTFRNAVISINGTGSLSTEVEKVLGGAEDDMEAWDNLDKEE